MIGVPYSVHIANIVAYCNAAVCMQHVSFNSSYGSVPLVIENFTLTTLSFPYAVVSHEQLTAAAAGDNTDSLNIAGGLYRHDAAFCNTFTKTQMHSNFLATAAVLRQAPAELLQQANSSTAAVAPTVHTNGSKHS
jgi:hypothetical protein